MSTRRFRGRQAVLLIAASACMAARADVGKAEYWQAPSSSDREDYIHEPAPPGVQIVQTELDGPVYADSNGRTLYGN